MPPSMPFPLTLPADVLAMAGRGEDWAAWVDGLARRAGDVVAEWRLAPAGAPMHGRCSLVLPVTTSDGEEAVLKLGFPHDEAEHEHLALQAWHGDGAVRLLRADPGRSALLLERLHRRDLQDVWDLEACEIVAGLYTRIHRPALPQLRTLASYHEPWAARLAALPRSAPVPRRLVEQAVSLTRDLLGDDVEPRTLHTDLHYQNVLAADREPWLAIDPKPVSGDPHHEVAPLLWNRWDELDGDYRGGVRRRFHATVDAAGFDEDRARDWVVVRMVVNAMWEIEDPGPGGVDTDWITRCVTIAKAVQE